jgi:hypothetical protein
MQDVEGIVVVLGILDETSMKLVYATPGTSNAFVNNMRGSSNNFPNATTNGIPVATWITRARTINSIPLAARVQIRVYQRYFPLNR